MELVVAVRMKQSKIARLIAASVDPLDDVVDVPPRRRRDPVDTDRTEPVLLVPEPSQLPASFQ